MPILFEYHKWEKTSNKDSLDKLLRDIWKKRILIDTELDESEVTDDSRYQPFLKFDNNEVRANNYVGFIQNGEELIEIYPKVFRHITNAKEKKELMLRHIFYWFSYCRKWRFPFNQASLDTIPVNEFPELIINLIAKQVLETVTNQPLTLYQHLEEPLLTPRGSVNFKRYISHSLSYGNFQNIECDYEPYLFDNKVNRIIKYCSRILLKQTKFTENVAMLQDVIFILDEVEDLPCTSHDIDTVSLNSFFSEYAFLMDSCKLILDQQLYSSNTYDLSQWCLLFPMEYIFEDFFAGFLENKFNKKYKVEYQKSNLSLSDKPIAFNMQHDIFLTSKGGRNRKIIIDTKYKLREPDFKKYEKKGVSQIDLYQMVSYAFKRGCTDVILVYPNLSESLNEPDNFEIISGFENHEKINVVAIEIPFWSFTDMKTLDKRIFDVIEECLTQILV